MVWSSVAATSPRRWLELTPDYRCNHRCVGCGAVSEGGPTLSARELGRVMLRGRREGVTQLWIGGGEPTPRRDLLPMVREARAQGYTRIRLQTNAAMLAYPELVQTLADAGVTDRAAPQLEAEGPTRSGVASIDAIASPRWVRGRDRCGCRSRAATPASD